MPPSRWSHVKERFTSLYVERTPQSKALFERARCSLAGGVSGNAGYRDPYPLYIADAVGTRATDVDGNTYLDMLMGGGPHILGHCPPAVVDAVIAQLAHGTSALAPSESAVVLAETIERHMPQIELLRFVSTGSEAMHMAVRAARAFTGRSRVGKFEGHFHGGYDNQLVSGRGFSGDARRPDALPDGAGIPSSVVADTLVLPFNDAEATVALIAEHADELAAVVVEPIAGTWMGGISAEAEFLQAVRTVTAAHDILLIFDEIVTGFRVALGGAAQLTGITPDLTAIAKIIGGGFPLGAFGGRADVMERVLSPPARPADAAFKMFHSGTYQNNLIALAAGQALLSELEQPGVLEHVNALGDRLREGVQQLGRRLDVALQTTGYGSIVGIHFADGPVRTLRDVLSADREAIATFCLGLNVHDIFITTYHLALTNGAQSEADIDHLLEMCGLVLETMVGASAPAAA